MKQTKLADSNFDTSAKESNKNIRVAIYVRVSTEEQKRDGFSIRSQIEKLTQYAGIKDWIIQDIYDDKGISGKNIEERPNLKRLLEDIKNKKVDVVLVFKLDRLTRSIRDLMELTDIFNAYKCEFCSLTENIDTHTASGRMFLKILGIFAEFERENLIERVKYGFERKAKEGYTNSKSIISYGYERSKGGKVLSVNVAESEIVRYIFKAFVSDFKSTQEIAKELNNMGIKSKGNSIWTNSNVYRILTNSTYIGKIRYSIDNKDRYEEFEGKHEAILDKELFNKAQTRIENSKKVIKTKTPKEDAFFTGLLYCSNCGNRMSGHKNYRTLKNGLKSIYIQYRCFKSKFGYCLQPSINHQRLETEFINYIGNIDELRGAASAPRADTYRSENKQAIEKLNREIEKLETKKKDIMQLFLKDELNFKEYKDITDTILLEITKKDNLILELEETKQGDESPEIQGDIILNMKESWGNFDSKEKMEFLRASIEKIVVSSEKVNSSNIVKIQQVIFSKNI